MTNYPCENVRQDNRSMKEVLSFIPNIERAFPEDNDFFETLAHEKRIIYDWKENTFWVAKGKDDQIEENQFSMLGTTFGLFLDAESKLSIDQILKQLLKNGICVDIRNARARFSTDQAIEEYLLRLSSNVGPLSRSSLDEMHNLSGEY